MTAPGNTELGHEGFMSAADLRSYMADMEMAKASKALQSMDVAEKARLELVKRLAEPMKLTPDAVQTIRTSLLARLKKAAENGETELMVMRFPVALCTDLGRAINNSDPEWPDSLTGRPRQAYELWRDHLRDGGFKLKAMIIEWPGGLPGDVGFFLNWSRPDV